MDIIYDIIFKIQSNQCLPTKIKHIGYDIFYKMKQKYIVPEQLLFLEVAFYNSVMHLTQISVKC